MKTCHGMSTSIRSYPGPKNSLGKRLVLYDSFLVMQELITRCKKQLAAIATLNAVQRQFIGTIVDTEAAVGYFFRKSKTFGGRWVAYIAAKMKYGGDLKFLAQLIGHLPPSRSYNANSIKHTMDLRWSIQTQGIVAYALLREVKPFLHNEKSIVEVDCILKHGPIVGADQPHPFVQCDGIRIRRGVWYWPQIDEPS